MSCARRAILGKLVKDGGSKVFYLGMQGAAAGWTKTLHLGVGGDEPLDSRNNVRRFVTWCRR